MGWPRVQKAKQEQSGFLCSLILFRVQYCPNNYFGIPMLLLSVASSFSYFLCLPVIWCFICSGGNCLPVTFREKVAWEQIWLNIHSQLILLVCNSYEVGLWSCHWHWIRNTEQLLLWEIESGSCECLFTMCLSTYINTLPNLCVFLFKEFLFNVQLCH